ncbi:MAG: efflux RND transporter periplasmic adaptor subunit [Bacteroidales bacterium]|nr:efflux RND transporter periplasmic adaptor subunit [Bacteroidales bacterium]
MNKIKYKLLWMVSVTLTMFSCNNAKFDKTTTGIEVPVSVIEIKKSSIEEFINTTGTVYPMKEVTLNSQMAGDYHLQVNPETKKPYALGDKVKEGALIVRLEDDEFKNNLRIKSKKVELEISKQEYEKQKSLYDKGGATLRELKNAEIKLINSEYDVESGNISLGKMEIRSPFNGFIADLPYFTKGTRVTNNTAMVSLINHKQLYLESHLPEKYFGSLERGLEAYITSYTDPLDTLYGKVTQIAPAIDPDARTFKCFIVVENKRKKILPGMFVKADLVIQSAKNTITIPKEIIVSRNRKQWVYVVEKGVAKSRFIVTGLENDTHMEVKEGLEVGEVVVSKGFETLQDDSKVKILK